jgi:hypothetical protein
MEHLAECSTGCPEPEMISASDGERLRLLSERLLPAAEAVPSETGASVSRATSSRDALASEPSLVFTTSAAASTSAHRISATNARSNLYAVWHSFLGTLSEFQINRTFVCSCTCTAQTNARTFLQQTEVCNFLVFLSVHSNRTSFP